MIKSERQNMILELVKERKYCTIRFLSERLYVAPITIRRDLAEMESTGLLARCYGGVAMMEHENRLAPYEIRNTRNPSVKEMLAKNAAKLITAGDTVFLDSSSTVNHMIKYLTPEQNLTIITNSTLVAEQLREKQIYCYLTGGKTIAPSHALVGSLAEQTLRGFYANVCFFSAQGIDENGIISDQTVDGATMRRMMIQNSKKQYFLFDGSKYGKRLAFKIGSVQEITDFITDLNEVSF